MSIPPQPPHGRPPEDDDPSTPGNYPQSPSEGGAADPQSGLGNPPQGPGQNPQSPQGGYAPPPPQGGYPPPSSQGGYPPQGGYGGPPPQGGYGGPPPQGGYPPPGGYGYPPPQGGYDAPPPGGYYPPQGGYPPPGGYGPPPQGGYYPPPTQGGFPPPPPPGNFPPYPSGGGGFGGGSPGFDIGEAFAWAWNKFSKNLAALIVPTLVYGLVIYAFSFIVNLLAGALAPTSTSSYQSDDGALSYSFAAGYGAASIAVLVVGYLLVFVAQGAVASAYYGGLLDIANGQPVQIGSFFKPRNVGSVLVASLLVSIVTFIGTLLCIIPGLAVSIFAMFTTVVIVERNLSPIDGIKASIDIVKRNFLQVLLVWIIVGVMFVAGAFLCGVGLLVAAPVALLLSVFAYRRFTGGQVAPHTP